MSAGGNKRFRRDAQVGKLAGKVAHCGLTLLEMLIVLAAISILTLLIPNLQGMVDRNRVTGIANEFFMSMQLARSEAIRRGLRVDLVPAEDQGDWTRGWIVFVDRDRDLRPDPEEELIAVHGPVAPGITIQSNLTDSSTPYIAFQETGRTRTHASREMPQFGSVLIRSGNDSGNSRKIVINLLGRARICTPSAGSVSC